MFAHFKPINDNILVELIPAEKTTASGIILSSQQPETTHHATVLHAGKSEQIKVSDTVYFKRYIGTALDDKYTVIKEEDIFGML